MFIYAYYILYICTRETFYFRVEKAYYTSDKLQRVAHTLYALYVVLSSMRPYSIYACAKKCGRIYKKDQSQKSKIRPIFPI